MSTYVRSSIYFSLIKLHLTAIYIIAETDEYLSLCVQDIRKKCFNFSHTKFSRQGTTSLVKIDRYLHLHICALLFV